MALAVIWEAVPCPTISRPLGPRRPACSWLDSYVLLEPITETGTADPPATSNKADLTASDLRVKGKQPSGNNDCDPGKNDVTVTVKNSGAADHGPFAVSLLVDDDEGDGGKEMLDALAKNQSRDVTFDNVKLKKGQHELKVQVDPEAKVDESSETNNELPVMVSCKNEDDN